MNKQKWKAALAEKGITQYEVAKSLNINPTTLSIRIQKGGADFTTADFEKLIEILGLGKVCDIFFGIELHEMQHR